MESRKGNAFDEMQSHREQSASIEVSFRALLSLLVSLLDPCERIPDSGGLKGWPYVRGYIQVFDIIIRGYIIF